MRTLVIFAAGALVGATAAWFVAIASLYRYGAPDVTGTISGPDGDWEIKGLRMSRLPVQP